MQRRINRVVPETGGAGEELSLPEATSSDDAKLESKAQETKDEGHIITAPGNVLSLTIENDELSQEQNTSAILGSVNELCQEMHVESVRGDEDVGSLSWDTHQDE
ncbi:hypothetical protein R1flu_009885 [Riccia fluitans]|uniref:Uncharacterized protein n=1 Tax=Riccia fluitans TaxID=41844 RepID=A0ABD1Z3E6_9MARC